MLVGLRLLDIACYESSCYSAPASCTILSARTPAWVCTCAGKRRQLETASSSDVLESDEQLARRLHEELNALTRHARRGAPAPAAQQHLQRSRSEKLPDTKVSRSVSKQRVPGEPDALQVSMPEGDKADKPARKRSMLNRELAMLVTDMVDSQLKPATGPRQTKSKDEQVVDQHKGNEQQQAQGIEQLLPILKHESSSSQSEQERLAMEHVQAAGADGTPQANNAQQQQQHFMARVSGLGPVLQERAGCLLDWEAAKAHADHAFARRALTRQQN